jgi:trimeric autotransporter adhesin
MKSPVRLNPASPLLFMTLVYFTFSALVPKGFAVVPPPDGGYPNFTTAEGTKALQNLTTGAANTGVGWVSLFSDTTGSFNTGVGAGTLALNDANENTATGAGALLSNSTGFQNTANGAFALLLNTTGSFNTAIGDAALYSNTMGIGNTATGVSALQNNTTGAFNSALGDGALLSNITGNNNTATGTGALGANITGNDNAATGFQALFSNTGDGNTATGSQALTSNTTGINNTANGFQALFHNTDGTDNTAIGIQSLFDNTGSSNTAIGHSAFINKSTGDGNIALGNFAGGLLNTGSHNIYIGNSGATNESNTIRIGTAGTQTKTFIAGIRDVTLGGALPVLIDAVGQLGTMSSSRRFKNDIKPMDKTSETILALKPVTFHYKSDSTNTPQFGLIAEEVAQVDPDLVVRDNDGEIYTVRYDAVNAMLLNEFLKEHRRVQKQTQKIQEQETTIAELKKQVQTVVAHAKEQDIKIQRVSDQIQINSSPVVVTDR